MVIADLITLRRIVLDFETLLRKLFQQLLDGVALVKLFVPTREVSRLFGPFGADCVATPEPVSLTETVTRAVEFKLTVVGQPVI